MSNKKAVFTYGRFNPPTMGHAVLFDEMISMKGYDPYIVVSHTQGRKGVKNNPLSPDDKMNLIKRAYPGVNVLATRAKTDNTTNRRVNGTGPPAIVKHLKGKPLYYNEVIMMVGSNRVSDFGFMRVPVISGGQRNNSNTNTTAGITATKLRTAALAGNTKNVENMMLKRKTTNNNQLEQNATDLIAMIEAGMTKPKRPRTSTKTTRSSKKPRTK